MTPRFIFFDLGNVLLKFDHRLACRQLATVTGATTARVDQVLFEDGVQFDFELGQLTNREFCQRLRSELDSSADDAQLLLACSAMFEVNEPIVPVVAALNKAGYPLGILSNTCSAHWEYITEGRYESLASHFDWHVLSFEVGAMKPDPRIYQVAVDIADQSPHEIFFMDDRSENVEGALKAGLDAVLFRSAEELCRDLRARNIELPLS